jgi:hypothetical protein
MFGLVELEFRLDGEGGRASNMKPKWKLIEIWVQVEAVLLV